MKKILIAMILGVLFTSCVTYTPPIKKDIVKTKDFTQSYDEVWAKITNWFTTKGLPIKNVDKNSGLITSEYKLDNMPSYTKYGSPTATSLYMDCGVGGYLSAEGGTINVLVIKKDNFVNVTINAFFSSYLSYSGYTPPQSVRATCFSNGTLEKEIFDFIGK